METEKSAKISVRTLRLILERCDADERYKLNSKQNSAPVKHEVCCDIPVKIKIENVAAVAIKREIDEDDGNFFEVRLPVKTEYVTSELVGCLPSSFEDIKPDLMLLPQIKNEESRTVKNESEEMDADETLPENQQNGDLDLINHFSGEKLNKDCSINFKTKLNSHTSKRLFECSHCTAGFNSESALAKHLKNLSENFLCIVCLIKFETNQELQTHLATHSAEKTHKCTFCSSAFETELGLKLHLSTHLKAQDNLNLRPKTRPPEPLKCFNCTKCTKCTKRTKCANCNKCPTCTKCPKCAIQFNSKRALKKHACHFDKPFLCPECPATFQRQHELKSHLIHRHTTEKLYTCHDCSAKFKTKPALKTHLVSHFPDTPFSCNKCDFKCKTKAALNQHKSTHTLQRDFCCSECSGRYKSKDILKKHIKNMHIGIEKRHKCSLCPYKTGSLGHFKQHLLVHDNTQPFECNQCHKKFKIQRNLTMHTTRVHMDLRPFKCDLCQESFRYKPGLRFHLQRHSTVDRFECKECFFTFPSKRSLEIHSSVHTGERKFACKLCPKTFKWNANLKLHLKTHTGEKPYACPYCPSKYTQKHNLTKHLETHA